MAGDHFHPESLEEFTAELAAAGFRLASNSVLPRWTGPIHSAFAPLSNATTMDIVIAPGWPFQPPAVFVQGLNTNHSTLDGLVCMWQEGDSSLKWTTLKGLFARVEEWCKNAEHGWEDDDLGQDALLNFKLRDALVATFQLTRLGVHESSWGEFHGVFHSSPMRIVISLGRKQTANQLRGLWFHAGRLKTPPPRQLSEILACLVRSQRKGLQRALVERRRAEPLVPSGGADLILFCWERHERTNLLVMACKGTGTEVEVIALQPGPNDEHSLILRAGPDASALRTRRAILFGAGALGGHTATLLAESGIGFLQLIDPDVLLPGNVVRHVAGHSQVGAPKVQAVQAVVEDHAPWTEVSGIQEAPRTPSDIGKRIADADIVIDTTGNEALVGSLAMVAKEMDQPLVSGALYRGGFISRVQRQVLASDTPIHQRGDLALYPLIPAGHDNADFATPQLGCSAPVNNAPPSAVLACASLIVQTAIDVLTERFEFPDEVIDVYRPIPDTQFNRMGRVGQNAEYLHNPAKA